MSDETTRGRVLKLVRHYFGEETVARAEAGNNIFSAHGEGNWTDGMLDSLDRAELVMAVEDEFKIEIPDVNMTGFRSLEDVVKYVDTMTAGPLHGAN